MSFETIEKYFGKYGDFLTRLVVGLIFILAGIGKLFGPAPGLDGFTNMLTGIGIPLPAVFAVLVGLIELVGGILLIVAWQDKWAALLLAFIMLVALLTVHLSQGWTVLRYPLLLFLVLVSFVGKKFSWKTAFSS